jgi:sugar/nucleoside kinase (ribokinase family)
MVAGPAERSRPPAARRVLVVGDIVTDVVVIHSGPIEVDSDTPARVTTTGGGAGANTAAWLAHAGARVALLGVVGDDADGATRIAELTAAGVDCSPVRRTQESPTGTIIVLSDGKRRTMLTDRGANHALAPSDVEDALHGVDHVHVSGYTLLDEGTRPAALRALALAGGTGLTTSVDAASAGPLRDAPAFLHWVAGVGLLFANLDEARVLGLSGGSGPAATARFTGEVVVKRGAAGAAWYAGDTFVSVPAPAVEVVDTTGAGDAFAAGFLSAWPGDPAHALLKGTELAARAVAQTGGRPL